jgi:tankyrase
MTVRHGQLSDVCTAKDPDAVRQRRAIVALLRAGADIGETDKNGVTPLHHAVRFRSPTAVKTLLEHGAKVNQVCKRSGSTPLHRAVTSTGAPRTAGKQREALEIIALLLKAGADPTIRNKSGKTPVDYVADEAIRKLLKRRRPPTTKIKAARSV